MGIVLIIISFLYHQVFSVLSYSLHEPKTSEVLLSSLSTSILSLGCCS